MPYHWENRISPAFDFVRLLFIADVESGMVTEYGMSDRHGPVSFEKERRPLYLEMGYSPTKAYSEETAHEIDEEVKELVNKAHEKPQSIVEANKKDIDRIAKILREREVLTGEELRKLLKESKEKAQVKAEQAGIQAGIIEN